MDSRTTSYSMTSAEGEIQPNQIGTIIVIDNLVYRDHPSLKLRGVPKDVRSHDIERVCNKEQLNTRVGCSRVHSIIENILDKCGVIAPDLPTKTDDLSHSTGHGWTTREKENSIRHYRRLHVSMVLHQDRLRRVRQMSTRLRRRLYAFLITRERLLDLDKEYGMKRWCTRRDKIS
uniref:Ulp1 protease-like protein n=1 Tax=Oryza sativa subsp. japonica TaxID=39947 RepID=Q6H5H9_ORYSJ|nr:Ulp1 protease-like protein [Oryza sativa Japonica Group]